MIKRAKIIKRHRAAEQFGYAVRAFAVLRARESPEDLYQAVMDAVDRPLLKWALGRCGGNQSASARLLGIAKGTMAARVRHLGLKPRLRLPDGRADGRGAR